MIKFLFPFSLCFFAVNVLAQCPQIYSGTKTLYPTPAGKYTAPSKGYTPVFINYVGRHGARHLTKDVNVSFAYAVLQRADSVQGLSADGKKLREMLLRLEKIEKTNFKSISAVGIQELAGIATRMVDHFSPVLQAAPLTTVEVTKEKRTTQSAMVFVNRVNELLKTKKAVKYQINDTTLRFFDIAPAYLAMEEKGNWQDSVEKLKSFINYNLVIEKTGTLFFTKTFLLTLNKKDLAELTGDIFGFITILPSIEKEIIDSGFTKQELNFQSFYTCDDLNKLGLLDNAEDFLLKGPATDSLGVQVIIAAPLLMDFIKTTDEFLNAGGPAIHLRFAHAETIAPFAALLNIKGAAATASGIDSFTDYWKAEQVVPLSANVQWIVYKKKNNYLVKLLLNEKEAAISGLFTKTFPYYPLKEVQNFYIKKLQRLGLGKADDYNKYLLNLK